MARSKASTSSLRRAVARTPASGRLPTVGHDMRVTSEINLAARLTNKAARIRLGSVGAWPGQIPILVWLFAEGGLLQKDLVERTDIEQSTVAEHLDRMQRDGLIARARDPDDGRKYRIFLTARGRQVAAELLEELENGARQFTRGIGRAELEVFHDVMARIIANLDGFVRAAGERDKEG
ncbi:MAG: MarR family winged helix-turn-helix transcriptional regulator [Rhodospirillales bacterium]